MPLPSSHKIVVIDDKPEEVASLIGTLSKNGIGVVYFTGQLEQLPLEPLSGIRIIFSDIDLVESKDNKTKKSALLGVFQKVISPDNGPYIIVFWTKHSDFIDDIKTELGKQGYSPLQYLCIEKSSCKDEKGEFSVSMIDQHIKESVDAFQAFNFYLEWENALLHSGENFVNQFHQLVPTNSDWSNNIYYLLYSMYKAETGSNDAEISAKEKFSIACRVFNKSFNNELDYYTSQITAPKELPTTIKGSISPQQIIPSVNSFLGIHKLQSSNINPGDVFKIADDELKEIFIKRLFAGREINSKDVTLVKCIVTPSCDIAQDKLLKDENERGLHRVVWAIILDSAFKFGEKNSLWYYKLGPFSLDGKNVCMHFHFATVSMDYSEKNEMSQPWFTIKQEIVFDIQSKIANHMNRLGNSLLE